MIGYINLQKEECIKIIENTCGLMINDTYSFVFLRSEGLNYLKEHSLGGGNFLMIIGQFAVLNYLAKTYSILCSGEVVYVTQEDVKEFENIREDLKINHSEVWKKIKKLLKKPRLWDFINETEAFVKLIFDYPGDLGIPKNDESMMKVWNDYRNKLSHIASIGNNNISVTLEYWDQKTYIEAKEFLENENGKPFSISSKEEKNRLEKEIFAENNKRSMPTNTDVVWKATADKLIPDFLSRDIRKIISWLIGRIKADDFDNINIKQLYSWLLMQHYVSK